MKIDALLALLAAKVNNRTAFKDDLIRKLSSCCPKKQRVEHQRMYMDTVKSQQVKVEKVTCTALARRILKWMCGVEIQFILHERCYIDARQKQCLRRAMMKHKQALANLVDFKLSNFEEIDSLIH